MDSSSATPPGADRVFPPVLVGDVCETINRKPDPTGILVCDHASPALPGRYKTLGTEASNFHRHIAYDPGAADLTRTLSAALGLPALLCGFSRLLIDPNRRADDPSLIVPVSDGVFIPANQDMPADEIAHRLQTYHSAYHRAVAREFRRAMDGGTIPCFVGVHSFTPVMHGQERPWEVSILWNRDPRLAARLLAGLRRIDGLCIGDNEPYSGRIAGYSMDRHGGDGGLPNAVIEVRQDLIDTHHGVTRWTSLLEKVLKETLADDSLRRIEHY